MAIDSRRVVEVPIVSRRASDTMAGPAMVGAF